MAGKHVFISYCRDNFQEVARLRDDLIAAGEAVWWDKYIRPGEDWKQTIRQAMKHSYAVIVCLSIELERRMESGVYPEIMDAIGAFRRQAPGGIFLIPVRLSHCEIPDIEIDDMRTLDRIEHVDLFPEASRAANFIRLLEALRAARTHHSETLSYTGEDTGREVPRVFLSRLPTTSGDFFGREAELAALNDTWEDPRVHVVMISGLGGTGKTALANRWLAALEQHRYKGAVRVYGWSFHGQGTTEDRQACADQFLSHALKWFGDPDPSQGAPLDKGARLAARITQSRTLLVLDGIEPLQYPPGPDEGVIRDSGLQVLLKELARAGADWGLCVLTTHIAAPELIQMTGASVQHLKLEGLTKKQGAQLLRPLGVKKGAATELEKAAGELRGHPMALTLLGRYLAVVHEGDIRKRDLVPAMEADAQQGGEARRMMESYELWLSGKPELQILHLQGLFDRPAEGSAIEMLRRAPPIQGLTDAISSLSESDWQFAVSRLRDLHLLDPRHEEYPDALSAHPLVREYCADVLKRGSPQAWKEAHNRLYEYYWAVPQNTYGKFYPDTLEEMEPLFRAVAHGCQAGRYEEALESVYHMRIRRGREAYTVKRLGGFGVDLAALGWFFEKRWSQPVAGLPKAERATVLNWAAFRLLGLGRLREAEESLQLFLQQMLRDENWAAASAGAVLLSELSLTRGNVARAVEYGRKGVELADRSDNERARMESRPWLADALHQSGDPDSARRMFLEAVEIQRGLHPRRPFLYSVEGYLYCDLLLSHNAAKAETVAKKSMAIAEQEHIPLDIALSALTLGRAALAWKKPRRTRESHARNFFNRAVNGLREAGRVDYLPRGLLARAGFHRAEGAWEEAWRDLAEVREIAGRNEMLLYLCDFHLGAARLAAALETADPAPERSALSGLGSACAHYEEAKALVDKTGYRRKLPELEALANR